jgi:hypothetical protein
MSIHPYLFHAECKEHQQELLRAARQDWLRQLCTQPQSRKRWQGLLDWLRVQQRRPFAQSWMVKQQGNSMEL